MYKVCALSGGPLGSMLVMDAGEGIFGNGICNSEEQNGWIPAESTQG